MSDVFVVPNLNVEFSEEYTIEWDNSACHVVEEVNSTNIPPLPVTTAMDLSEGKTSLAFYNRYHVIYSKIPDLFKSKRNKEAEKIKCGCEEGDPSMLHEDCNCDHIDKDIDKLQDGLNAWYAALKKANDETGIESIVKWFDNAKTTLNFEDVKVLKISDQSSSLSPPELTEGANETIKQTQRIQVSGGGNTFEMHVSKEKLDSKLSTDCWGTCNVITSTNYKASGLSHESNNQRGKIRTEDYYLAELIIYYEQESVKSTENSEQTDISFVLGDNDPGDEFVVEVYFDNTYGTIFFKTVLGVSKCPHEEGTAPLEVPHLEVSRYPPQNVFPDEKMIFEIELANLGVGNETIMWLSSSAQKNVKDGLRVTSDGIKMGGVELTNVEKNMIYKRLIEIERGPIAYKSPSVELGWESKCEDADSL